MQIEELLKCLSLPKRYYGETFVIREKLKEENKKFQRDLKGGCRQNLGLIMQQSQDDVYTQSDSARPAIS